ncbi:siderophore-interacting protein [Acetobacter lambici]|uniref:Siderophore-interacting protein n=1 Tax=Acetobacter lambici TaxID=1332824 RepID=A0ABT1F4B3_9PROT|nr:siderophore-interacting protein [Acetobacter lambici]MCP1242952.1 siderophore-interacting protein [Acetobacter lambici]MCP1259119.1 siderophore-interacting protein [Acetobacter lambici]NHO57481.1 siderophore-interacting protein [Acetobacter lambici]
MQTPENGRLWPPAPMIEPVRHPLRRRSLSVAAVERLTPHMIRITLSGPELADFASAAPDDHIKIFLPGADGAEVRRDYTPRHYNPQTATLVLDFVDHHGGPAAAWARAAQVGDRLDIGGPKGSRVISNTAARWLLVGDETALPAIGRRVEELPAHASATTVVAVPGAADEQHFATSATHHAHWVHRPMEQADQAQAILAALGQIAIEPGTFVWVGAEAHVARAVRRYLLEERYVPVQWVKASGYWVMGQADASVRDVEAMG